jgi:hypothetical protein
MRHAVEDLKLNKLDVIHAGDESYPMAAKIRAVALKNMLADVRPMK